MRNDLDTKCNGNSLCAPLDEKDFAETCPLICNACFAEFDGNKIDLSQGDACLECGEWAIRENF